MRSLLAFPLLLPAGCGGDTLPLALQNMTGAPLTVLYASKDDKCGPARPETLAPGERLLARCAPADLLGVTITMPGGRTCNLSQADVAGRVQERKGMKGSFLLPLEGC